LTSLKNQSTKAFAWDFAGKIAGQSVGFVISIFLARLLTPEDFGLLAMVNVVIALSASLMDMGLGVALIQRKEVSDAHYGSVFFFNIVIGTLLAAILFFAAPLVGYFYDNAQLVTMARAMSALFILRSIGNVLRMKLRKDLEYGIPTQGNLLGASISGIIGIAMAFSGYGVWSLVIQSLLNPIIANFYLFYRVKWRPKLVFQWQALKELWSFGFRMFLSGILDTIFRNADSLIIGKLFSAATLGFYFRARSLNTYITQYTSNSLMSVLLPAFSMVQDDLVRFKKVVFKSYHMINLMAFFLTGLFFVVGDHLILFLFGEKWQASIPLFRLIILTAYGLPLSSILVNILSASGNSKSFLKLEVIKKVFFGLALGFGFLRGIEGYLIANVIAFALAVYVNIVFAGKQLKTGQWWFIRITLPYLFLTILVASISYYMLGLIGLNHLLSLIMGGVVYTIVFILIAFTIKLHGISLLLIDIRELGLLNKLKSK
jgi:O-antigen/teichoic acid export membrane protein